MSQNSAYRVLIVDDDETIRESLAMALAERGHRVLLASDGNEVLSCIERDAPDVVVLDMMIPRRSGFAVLDHLQKRPNAGPKVVMVSGSTDPRHEQMALTKGALAFFRKPFDVAQLIAQVELLLKSSRPQVAVSEGGVLSPPSRFAQPREDVTSRFGSPQV
ncbi:MAG: response regulator transcription factor [Planctomycetales bacterium]|nr:response regulator transcription factor [Planctomycetales bacterium]